VRVLRLPAIHHDANLVLIVGSLSTIVIDAGTSWYQGLQVERIKGIIGEDGSLDRVLLTSKRFPCSGGARHLSDSFPGCKIHVHADGQSALETGDFFTTWANRYDSDMPSVQTEVVDDGEVFVLGNGHVESIHLPGHSSDGMGYWIPESKMMIVGPLIPRADRPTRWDLPSGCLPDLVTSLQRILALKPHSVLPFQGPAIKGAVHVKEVLTQHLKFFEQCVEDEAKVPASTPKPAATALWYSPHPPWPLDEQESS